MMVDPVVSPSLHRAIAPSVDLRRALQFIVPYWRRLALVMVLCLASTAVSLYLPLLSRDVFDGALLGRDPTRLVRLVGLFAVISLASFGLNVLSGLRYTRVSADILFDMRLAMYRHLHQLSPRFYARTRLGDIMSRINNDIGEIQRIAAETALAWFGNVLFLVGTVAMLIWLDARLFLISAATAPFGIWALVRYQRRLEGHVTVLRAAQRRHRQLPDRDAAGRAAGRDVERAGARGRALPRQERGVRPRADVDAAPHLLRGRLSGAHPDGRHRRGVSLRRPRGDSTAR